MSKSVRTTISIPGDLKAAMDAVEHPVNWSAIAAEAFKREIEFGPALDGQPGTRSSPLLTINIQSAVVTYNSADSSTHIEGTMFPRDLELVTFLVNHVKAFVKHGPQSLRAGWNWE